MANLWKSFLGVVNASPQKHPSIRAMNPPPRKRERKSIPLRGAEEAEPEVVPPMPLEPRVFVDNPEALASQES